MSVWKVCSIPFCTATVFMSVKDITWLLNSLCTTNWYTKCFHVYWLISYANIFSGGIKWHLNSIAFSAVWVDILSDLLFDGFRYYLVYLRMIWRTTTTRQSTKITQKVIILVQMLTILTYAYCVTVVWTCHEDQRHQRSSIGQQRTEKTRKARTRLPRFIDLSYQSIYFEWLVSF